MRSYVETNEALAFWTKTRDEMAANPESKKSPAFALVCGIVWTLQWVTGRDREEIIAEAQNEEWLRGLGQ